MLCLALWLLRDVCFIPVGVRCCSPYHFRAHCSDRAGVGAITCSFSSSSWRSTCATLRGFLQSYYLIGRNCHCCGKITVHVDASLSSYFGVASTAICCASMLYYATFGMRYGADYATIKLSSLCRRDTTLPHSTYVDPLKHSLCT